MLNAVEARQQVEVNIANYKTEQLVEVEQRIKKAIAEGRCSVLVKDAMRDVLENDNLLDVTKTKLVELGYTVTEGVGRCGRDVSISW